MTSHPGRSIGFGKSLLIGGPAATWSGGAPRPHPRDPGGDLPREQLRRPVAGTGPRLAFAAVLVWTGSNYLGSKPPAPAPAPGTETVLVVEDDPKVREVAVRAPRGGGYRVLYVSGYTHDAISRQGLLDEGIEFLPKPFTSAALLARVRAVLDRA